MSRFYLIIKILITILLIFILFKFVDISRSINLLKELNRLYLFIALLLLIPNLLLLVIRWHYLLKIVEPTIHFKDAVKSLLAGFTLGSITPGRIGDFGRALYVSNSKKKEIIGMLFIEKLYIFSTNILLGIIASHQFVKQFSIKFILLVLPFILLFFLLFPNLFIKPLLSAIESITKNKNLNDFIFHIKYFNAKNAIVLIIISILTNIFGYLQLYILISSYTNVAIIKSFSASAMMILTSTLLPISISGLGVRELSSTFFFSQIEVEKEFALNGTFILFIINVFIPSLIGTIFVTKVKKFYH